MYQFTTFLQSFFSEDTFRYDCCWTPFSSLALQEPSSLRLLDPIRSYFYYYKQYICSSAKNPVVLGAKLGGNKRIVLALVGL